MKSLTTVGFSILKALIHILESKKHADGEA